MLKFGSVLKNKCIETHILFSYVLSSYGQNLMTSTFIGETSFAILIAILGLVLFAHLIGNMQVRKVFALELPFKFILLIFTFRELENICLLSFCMKFWLV